MSTMNHSSAMSHPAGAFGIEHLLPAEMDPNRDAAWLVSIFPGILRAEFNYLCLLDKPTPGGKNFAGVTRYVTEPASREKPCIMPVYRTLTWTIGSAFSPIDGTPTTDRKLVPVFADMLADELIRQWTTGLHVVGGETIGITRIPSPNAITPQFLDQLHAMQQNYFRQIVDKGNEHYAKGTATHQWEHLQNLGVGSIFRIAAKAIGASVPWAHDVEIRGKQCLFCRKDILLDQPGCEHCGTNLIDFALEENFPYTYAQLQVIDPFVAQIPAVMKKFGQAVNPAKAVKAEDVEKMEKAARRPKSTPSAPGASNFTLDDPDSDNRSPDE